MTNYKPIKDKIWAAVKDGNLDAFDSECSALIEKAANDWWRIGWDITPSNAAELVKLLERAGETANKLWLEAVRIGDAPMEDVSPGEGFYNCAKLVKDLIDKSKIEEQ